MTNWARKGSEWFPLDMLAPTHKGPVVFADESALDNDGPTVTWFSPNADRSPIKHKEHARDPSTGQVRLRKDERGQEHPVWTDEREIAPAFWAPAVVVP